MAWGWGKTPPSPEEEAEPTGLSLLPASWPVWASLREGWGTTPALLQSPSWVLFCFGTRCDASKFKAWGLRDGLHKAEKSDILSGAPGFCFLWGIKSEHCWPRASLGYWRSPSWNVRHSSSTAWCSYRSDIIQAIDTPRRVSLPNFRAWRRRRRKGKNGQEKAEGKGGEWEAGDTVSFSVRLSNGDLIVAGLPESR